MTLYDAPVSLTDEVLDFLSSTPSLDDIITMRPSQAIQDRARYLLEQNRAHSLTAEEQLELDEFMRMDHFITMLKARARKKLQESA